MYKSDEELEKEFRKKYWTQNSLLGYRNWRDFHNTVKKAQVACNKSGQETRNHFEDTLKKVSNFRILLGRYGEHISYLR